MDNEHGGKIVVWGEGVCTECQFVFEQIQTKFPQVEKRSVTDDLSGLEDTMLRADIQGAIAMQNNTYPVVQLGSIAYEWREAFQIMGLEE